MTEEFDYSTLPAGERAKLFKCLEVLSNEVYQTQAFLLRALGRAGLLISPHPGPKLVAKLEAAEALYEHLKGRPVRLRSFAEDSFVAAWDEATR